MTNEVAPSNLFDEEFLAAPEPDSAAQVVPCRIGGQLYGVPLEFAGDMVVLTAATVTPIAFAPARVRGAVSQKGRMATVIDSRLALGLPPAPANSLVGLTVEHDGHQYILTVDEVGELATVRDGLAAAPTLDLAAIVGAR